MNAVALLWDRCRSNARWENFIVAVEVNPRKPVPTLSQPYDHVYPVVL